MIIIDYIKSNGKKPNYFKNIFKFHTFKNIENFPIVNIKMVLLYSFDVLRSKEIDKIYCTWKTRFFNRRFKFEYNGYVIHLIQSSKRCLPTAYSSFFPQFPPESSKNWTHFIIKNTASWIRCYCVTSFNDQF